MPLQAYVLETCRGVKPAGCPQALPLPQDFFQGLEALLAQALVPPGLAALGRELRHHECFRASLCACPNGCARPHVADLGLLAAAPVRVDPTRCTGCGLCLPACPDRLIRLGNDRSVLPAAACLGCGACVAACPSGALTAGQPVLRVLLGGRLGRRPRLGTELSHRFSPTETLTLTDRCLAAYARDMRPGRRFADIVFPPGRPGLPAWVHP